MVVTRPALTSPFVGASELTVRGDVGTITQADGFATFGESARLLRDRRGRATSLWLGGAQFDADTRHLKQRLDGRNGRT